MPTSFGGSGGGIFPTTFMSLPVYKGLKTLTGLTLTATYTGTIQFQVNATTNESNWENVTSGTLHTMTNTGTQLRWRAMGIPGAEITSLIISYILSA